MKISKYHIIKYILENIIWSNININSNNKIIETEFNIIRKIFKNNIPRALIEGLKSKNIDYLTLLCNKYIIEDDNRKNIIKTHKEPYNIEAWTKKQIATNKQYMKKKTHPDILKEKEEQKRIAQESARVYNEQYIKIMTPIWKEDMDKIISTRNEIYNTIFNN